MTDRGMSANISPELIVDECVAVRLRLLTRAVSRLYNRALRPYGLTISQMNILVAVSYLGQAKHQQICQALSLDKSSLSRDVERMHDQGWLETLEGDDGRVSMLRVTAAGAKVLKRASPGWCKAQEEAKALLGEAAIVSLQRAVGTLRALKSTEPG